MLVSVNATIVHNKAAYFNKNGLFFQFLYNQLTDIILATSIPTPIHKALMGKPENIAIMPSMENHAAIPARYKADKNVQIINNI
jgi:hypothetical protein